MQTHTHRTPVLSFIHNTHPFSHNLTPQHSPCIHTYSLTHSYHFHPYSHKQNTSPCSWTYPHSDFFPHTETPPVHPQRTPWPPTPICSAPPCIAACWEDFYREAEGAALEDTHVPIPSPTEARLRAHLAFENSQGRGALPEGWAQLGCHSWNPPHSSTQGCPPGCSWQQVCSSNAGVGGGGGGRNENQAHGTTWSGCWLGETLNYLGSRSHFLGH